MRDYGCWCTTDINVVRCAGCSHFQYLLDNGFYVPTREDEQLLMDQICALNQQLVLVCQARSEED